MNEIANIEKQYKSLDIRTIDIKSLNIVEEAVLYDIMRIERNMTLQNITNTFNVSMSRVSNTHRILFKLHSDVIKLALDNKVAKHIIYVLMRWEKNKQKLILEKFYKEHNTALTYTHLTEIITDIAIRLGAKKQINRKYTKLYIEKNDIGQLVKFGENFFNNLFLMSNLTEKEMQSCREPHPIEMQPLFENIDDVIRSAIEKIKNTCLLVCRSGRNTNPVNFKNHNGATAKSSVEVKKLLIQIINTGNQLLEIFSIVDIKDINLKLAKSEIIKILNLLMNIDRIIRKVNTKINHILD